MERKAPEITAEQRQREVIYKKIAEINNWRDAFATRYQHWRGQSVSSQGLGMTSAAYLTGRADSWEEIIEMITKSEH